MHRFIAPEKEIAQITELPARRMIHQQHVDAVVADRHVGTPDVVVCKQLAVQRLGAHRISHDPVGRRLMRQPDLALPIVRRDLPLLLFNHVGLAQQRNLDRAARRAGRTHRRDHPHAIPEEHRFRRGHIGQRHIKRQARAADHDATNRCPLRAEAPRHRQHRRVGVVQAVAHQQHARQMLGGDLFEHALQRGREVGRPLEMALRKRQRAGRGKAGAQVSLSRAGEAAPDSKEVQIVTAAQRCQKRRSIRSRLRQQRTRQRNARGLAECAHLRARSLRQGLPELSGIGRRVGERGLPLRIEHAGMGRPLQPFERRPLPVREAHRGRRVHQHGDAARDPLVGRAHQHRLHQDQRRHRHRRSAQQRDPDTQPRRQRLTLAAETG